MEDGRSPAVTRGETSPLLVCKDAAFGYDGHVVIRDLNFAVGGGDYLCVVGENGSGKSTLIKGLLRLLSPLEGSVSFRGIGRGDLGYLAQDAGVKKDFPAGAGEVVLSGNLSCMGLRPFYTRGEKRGAEENMERLGVGGLWNRCFRELSGGEQRRVLLARTLCAGRKLLVLDEPAAGLDPLAASELYRLLGELNRERGIAVIMVSHDVEGMKKYAGKILNLGRSLPGLDGAQTQL